LGQPEPLSDIQILIGHLSMVQILADSNIKNLICFG